ncbi:MAG: hypothetical protein IEMM0008_1434 [bacterium]|nr:MAG: hypothetical protein IEMM0008_1434 [bacterium]
MQKTHYEEIIINEIKDIPADALPQVIQFVQSLKQALKERTTKSESGLCGIWNDQRDANEIIEDIYSHRKNRVINL